MALILHELGANCVKYGALLSSKGRVSIRWTVADNMLTLEWIERGGPIVSARANEASAQGSSNTALKGAGGSARILSESEGSDSDHLIDDA